MTWSRVQTFSQNAQFALGPFTNTAVTLGSAVSVGDTILLCTCVGGNTTTFAPTVTDQLGNTYTKLTSAQGGQLFDSANSESMDAWWCIVTAAGTPTITYKPDTAQRAWLGIKGSHFTGTDAASTMRDSKGALQTNPGTGANAITTASIAASSGDLLWGGSGNPGPALLTEVSGTGFTTSTRDATTSLLDEWLPASGAAAVTFTDSTNGGGSVFETFGIAITPASSGSKPPLLGSLLVGPRFGGIVG